MKEKRNIDDLFKEKFKNFEETPSPKVWNNIQAKLKENDDRKVIPLWLKLGGIAALLALLFTVGNSIFNINNTTTSPIVTKEHTEIKKLNTDKNTSPEKDNSLHTTTNNEAIASEEKTPKSNKQNNASTNNTTKKKEVSETSFAYKNNSQKTSTKVITNPNIKTSTGIKSRQDAYVNENIPTVTSENNNKNLIKKDIEVVSKKEAIATENGNDKNVISEENTSKTEAKKDNTKSIFDAINEIPEDKTIVASTDNKPNNRWDVTPTIAPIYYNTLGEGSSIDPSFSDNPKKGAVTFSYGVQVNYNVNKRLSIRSGLSNVNLSYATTGLELGTGSIASATESIDYQGRDIVTIPVDKGSLDNQDPDGGFGTITPKSTSGEVSLNQNISYYEVPLELKYALINNKFGINLIGGFSTLILGTNEVTVDAGDFNDVLGEANNLSSLSFTTNIGLGLNYSFSKKLMISIEPMFKYQLNPYTDAAVDFKPYYLGLYSGLSFKF